MEATEQEGKALSKARLYPNSTILWHNLVKEDQGSCLFPSLPHPSRSAKNALLRVFWSRNEPFPLIFRLHLFINDCCNNTNHMRKSRRCHAFSSISFRNPQACWHPGTFIATVTLHPSITWPPPHCYNCIYVHCNMPTTPNDSQLRQLCAPHLLPEPMNTFISSLLQAFPVLWPLVSSLSCQFASLNLN